MIQTFLTGHPVAGLRAQGVRGLPVTDYSEQIHALLCLRGMHKIADCFAVPLRSRPQHELQWYSPLRGVVIRWSEADIQQKQRALLMLEQAYAAIEQLSELCQAAKTPAGVFFARLLEKMDSFPGEEAIYLVNNDPVITFWSYRQTDRPLSGREITKRLSATLPPQPEPPEKSQSVLQPVSLFLPAEDNGLPVPATDQTINPPRSAAWLATALIVGAMLVAVGGYFSGGLLQTAHQLPEPAIPALSPEIVVTPSPITLPDIRLPVQFSTLQKPVTLSPSPVVIRPIPQVPEHLLQLPASAVKMGDISVMDGDWRAVIADPAGNSQVLLFHFQQGRGEVRTNITGHGPCKAESRSGFLPSGTLAIRSRFRASCHDGSRTRVPPVNCTLTATGTLCKTTTDAVPPGQTVILSAAGGR
ncbi:SrfA family protein [Tatumella citrea]|uniref:SrfA n=1 Tax=Tatumella citrea TaxID=53336 RepID=A0A1Y0L791_TATCI|nr:SrfA family protein [Tatumella citrea]ARU93881.1 hypothetical protein A7K98_08895 [Tatumella citrea]ARU97919.1 hypothetical protein A7K99_08895 [Tatumella citrea]